MFVTVGTLIVSVVSLIIAVLILRNVRRAIELAEDRVEYLREEQARLAFEREERRRLEEELKREREQRLEAEQRAERLGEEHLQRRDKLGQSAEELEQSPMQQREDKQEVEESEKAGDVEDVEEEVQQEGWKHRGDALRHADPGAYQQLERVPQGQPREFQQGSSPPGEEKSSTEPENTRRLFRNIFRRS